MRLALFAAAALSVSSLAAHADTVESLSLNATLYHGVATGIVTFDETTGLFTGGNVTATYNNNEFNFTVFEGSASYDTITFAQVNTANGNQTFQLTIPGASDKNYMGGAICSDANYTGCQVTGGPAGDYYYTGFIYNGNANYASSGALSPLNTTPEPSSVALLATGMLGIAGVARKRFA